MRKLSLICFSVTSLFTCGTACTHCHIEHDLDQFQGILLRLRARKPSVPQAMGVKVKLGFSAKQLHPPTLGGLGEDAMTGHTLLDHQI